MKQESLKTKNLFQYSFLALPVAFAGFPLYVLAPDFYATHYNLSLTLLGTLLLLIRLLDAIQDPWIGSLTDRMKGNFSALITIASIILCASIAGLFNMVFFSPAVWFTTCMCIAISAYSVLTIVLGTQGTLWTSNPTDQIRIASAREAFGLIGLIIAVSMPTLLGKLTQPNTIYLWYVVILSLLTLFALIGFQNLLSSLNIRRKKTTQRNISIIFAIHALQKDTRWLLAIYAINSLAASVPVVLVLFYVRDLLGAEHYTAGFLLTYFLSGIAGIPIWKKVSAHVGKYKAWGIANILAIIGFIGAFFLGYGDLWPYGLVCIISGLALGADLTLPAAILADHIHTHNNRSFAATHYALFALITKLSLAIASVVSLPLLDAAGFKPNQTNSSEALGILSTTYALFPCALKLTAATLLYLFFIRFQNGETNATTQSQYYLRNSNHA